MCTNAGNMIPRPFKLSQSAFSNSISSFLLRTVLLPAVGSSFVCLPYGKRYHESAALVRFAFCCHVSIKLLNDAIAHCKSEARALFSCGVKRIEYPAKIFRSDAGSGILEIDDNTFILPSASYG